jgi:hypothetical protein
VYKVLFYKIKGVYMKEFQKIIWQTHQWEYNELPELYKKTSETWKVMNPNWDYRYIPNSQIRNEIEKISTNYKLLECFDRQPNILSKADVYREVMVYEYGGLWADMDSVCLFPIDKIIENNTDKEMICIPPVYKFGMNPETNYQPESTEDSLNRLLSGTESGYWISNAAFLGKKHNKISEEIVKAMSGEWNFRESSFMGTRAELYEKYHKDMSLDLLCAFHDGRLNIRSL